MSVVSERAELLALIVEDIPKSLEARRELLEAHGFAVLGVATLEDAVREFVAGPAVDLVMTDIDLDPGPAKNTEGVSLARHIRSLNGQVPLIGYSGAFAEGELTDSDLELFDTYLPRGASGPAQIENHVSDWINRAKRYRSERKEQTLRTLESLRTSYPQSDLSFATLRLLAPGDELDISGRTSIEDILRRAGFRLQLVDTGAQRPTIDDGWAHFIAPVAFWVKRVPDGYVAEVYGHSILYGFGDDEKAAINQVLLLMDGFHRQLNDADGGDDKLTPLTDHLKQFLNRVLG